MEGMGLRGCILYTTPSHTIHLRSSHTQTHSYIRIRE
ncbi:hypothetical protein JMJ77_0001776, partial [Colletotrichum scovillei]